MAIPSFKLVVGQTPRQMKIIGFNGRESMNRLFSYELIIDKVDYGGVDVAILDVLEMEGSPAELEVNDPNSVLDADSYTITISGYIESAELCRSEIRLVMVPHLKQAHANQKSEIYFDESATRDITEIITEELDENVSVFQQSNLSTVLNVPKKKITTQFQESNFNFIARQCDYWGIQFYFDYPANLIGFSNDRNYQPLLLNAINNTLTVDEPTAGTPFLKIELESLKSRTIDHYYQVVGYDPENASGAIESTYQPAGNLAKHTLVYTDVITESEANYLAEQRYLADACLKRVVTFNSRHLFLFPGFTVKIALGSTNTQQPAEDWLIISVDHKAENLMQSASANTNSAPQYFCQVKAIPATELFVPSQHYPIPMPSKVIGKVMELSNNGPDVNANGEYRVQPLGFDEGFSFYPYMRQAQTTAGGNSNNVPLLPNTEVLINFQGNNVNCPYIESVFNNSMHPSQVNSHNSHHAVISTQGTLVHRSEQGRIDLSKTKSTQILEDASFNPPVLNYLADRINGPSDELASINPPETISTNNRFKADLEASGEWDISRRYGDKLIVKTGDELHWHHGIKYEFSQLGSYNFYGRYSVAYGHENVPIDIKVLREPVSKIKIKAAPEKLRTGYSGDLMSHSGPENTSNNDSSLDFSKLRGVFHSIAELNNEDIKLNSDVGKPIVTDSAGQNLELNRSGKLWDIDGMDVRKTYNQSYDYKFGDSVKVQDRNNYLNANFVDEDTVQIDIKLHEGQPREFSKEEGAYYEYKKWSKKGVMYTQEFEEDTNDGWQINKNKWHAPTGLKKQEYSERDEARAVVKETKDYNFVNGNALSAHKIERFDGMGFGEVNFSFAEKGITNLNFGGETKFELSAQHKVSLAISMSGNLEVEVKNGGFIKIQTGLTANIDLDLRKGTKLVLDADGKLEAKTLGLQALKDARVKARDKQAEIDNIKMSIVNVKTSIQNATIDFKIGSIMLSQKKLNIHF